MEGVGVVEVGGGDVVAGPRGERELDRLVEPRPRALLVAEREERAAEPVDHPDVGAEPGPLEGFERLWRLVADVAEAALQEQEADPLGQQRRALRRVLVGSEQGQATPLARAAALRKPERPLAGRERGQHLRCPPGVGLLVDLLHRGLVQRRAHLLVAGEVMRAPGAGEDLGVIGAGALLGLGHPVPELQRPVEQARSLPVRVQALDGARRGQR